MGYLYDTYRWLIHTPRRDLNKKTFKVMHIHKEQDEVFYAPTVWTKAWSENNEAPALRELGDW